MALANGSHLGSYEILSSLGSGGMGEVYRARDKKLNRDVAIKVLAESVRDAEHVARFQREAQSIAALNHPNIVTIHSVEDANGVFFLTMELVEGKVLSEVIDPRGLPLTRLLEIAIPLVDAVSAAHEKGITHRDLKPANVMVTGAGRVKVLDFGLAKLVEPALQAAGVSALPTRVQTGEGHIVGTVAYMSPEQAEGKLIDQRSDIFSLGVMLYEMATGERPFRGDTPVSTMTSILRDTPPAVTEIRHTSPRDLSLIVRRCLAKQPEQRTQSAKDLRNQLQDLQHALETGELAAPAADAAVARSGDRWRWAAAAATALFLGTLGAWGLTGGRPAQAAPVITQVARLTHDSDFSEWATWSPDGSLLAFASNKNGNFDIYVRRVDGGKEVNVTNNESENFQPAFSPDGRTIAFVSTRSSRTRMVKVGQRSGSLEGRTYGGDVWIVPALGGQARRLASDGNDPAWHPSGRKVAYVSGPEGHRSIHEVGADGGSPQPLLASASSSWEIIRLQYSPHARWITFDTSDNEVLLVAAGGGEPRKLVNGFSHVWDPVGAHLYYFVRDSHGGTRVESIGIDERTGMIAGEAVTIGLMTGVLRDLAVSRTGDQLVVTEDESSMNLARLPLNAGGGAAAGGEELLSAGQVFDGQPSVSPDGRQIVFSSNRLGLAQIWLLHLDTKRMDVLPLPGEDMSAVGAHWYPDGRRLLVQRAFASGKVALWWMAADGSTAEELLTLPSLTNNFEGWPIARDGLRIVYGAGVSGHSQLFEFEIGTKRSRQITSSPDDKFSAIFSPDDRWVVYTSNANGSNQLWRMPARGGKAEPLTKGEDRVRHMFYSPDGRWLYYQPNHLNIYRMPANGGQAEQVTRFPESGLFLEEPTISPDGHYLVYTRRNGGSSLWVLQLGHAQPTAP
jgi:Tol biopolymer transport system component/tRNA A-37 threonylcarbamoyl transferase component Bud32